MPQYGVATCYVRQLPPRGMRFGWQTHVLLWVSKSAPSGQVDHVQRPLTTNRHVLEGHPAASSETHATSSASDHGARPIRSSMALVSTPRRKAHASTVRGRPEGGRRRPVVNHPAMIRIAYEGTREFATERARIENRGATDLDAVETQVRATVADVRRGGDQPLPRP